MITAFVIMHLIWSILTVIANIRDPMPNPRASAIVVGMHSISAVVAICILCGAK